MYSLVAALGTKEVFATLLEACAPYLCSNHALQEMAATVLLELATMPLIDIVPQIVQQARPLNLLLILTRFLVQVDTVLQILMRLLPYVQAQGSGHVASQKEEPKAQAVMLLLKLAATGCFDSCRDHVIVRAPQIWLLVFARLTMPS
jgi:hypothetical protein